MITVKKLRKSLLKEMYTALHLRRPPTIINKGFELAENVSQEELRNHKKHNNENPFAYVST